MYRTRGVLLAAIVGLGALAAMPARAEFSNVFVGPGRFLTGSMSKLDVTATFVGYIDTGPAAGTFDGEPYADPLVEEVFGVVTVRKGTVARTAFGSYTVTIDPALGTAKMSGNIDGVSINVTLTGTGNPAPALFTPDPGDIDPPSFVYAAVGLDVTRSASVSGSASATGVGEIIGGTGSGVNGLGAGAYIYYEDF